ncbi:hypothetical protein [Microvirga makkahensis]|uniref:Uncharacterized protein n=1 Tax=Microvirga makkahensis TaxID=1128670 RepID=A0A7X3MTB4_9HYPH|nr:hypothetical protein [Microvirga makkahensis]MXQ12595.1 hypothetical protein [Microvirga makkahensis]
MGRGAVLRFLILLAYVGILPVGLIMMMATAAWLSDRTHHFDPYDIRYLLLIRGTQVENLDLVEPIPGTVQYGARGQDGTAPAFVEVTFKTRASPVQVIDTYFARCRASGFAAQQHEETSSMRREVICERENPSAVIGIEAAEADELTEVIIFGWEFE